MELFSILRTFIRSLQDITRILTPRRSFDVIKSRIQNTTKVAGVIPKYNWTLPSVALVVKEEGFTALYKGFLPKVLRLGPGGGILLVVFTTVVDYWKSTQVVPEKAI